MAHGYGRQAAWAPACRARMCSPCLREYCIKVGGELQMICNTIGGLLDQMRADYYRYIAEFTSGDAKSKAAYCAEAACAEAAAVAEKDFAVTHPIRMGLALNYFCTTGSPSRAMIAKWRARLLRTPSLSWTRLAPVTRRTLAPFARST